MDRGSPGLDQLALAELIRSGGATTPAQLVLGFGNTGERAIAAGIAAVGDLLEG